MYEVKKGWEETFLQLQGENETRRGDNQQQWVFHSIPSQHQQQPFVFGNTLHQDYYICMLFQTAMEKAASNYVD